MGVITILLPLNLKTVRMKKTVIYLLTVVSIYWLFDSLKRVFIDYKKLPEYSHGFLMGQVFWIILTIVVTYFLIRFIKKSKKNEH